MAPSIFTYGHFGNLRDGLAAPRLAAAGAHDPSQVREVTQRTLASSSLTETRLCPMEAS